MQNGTLSSRVPLHFLNGVLLCSLAVVVLAGCEQVKSVVDDVKSEVSGSPAAPAPPAAPVGTTQNTEPTPMAPVQAPATPAAPPSVSPQELVAQFSALKPYQITDSHLAEVANVPEAANLITEITTVGDSVSETGISLLTRFPQLRKISFTGNVPQTPAAFRPLTQIPSLLELDLTSCSVDDAFLASLSAVPHLHSLTLDNTRVSSAGIASLKSCLELESLSLHTTAAGDDAIAALVSLPLKKISLYQTQLTDNGLAHLARIPTLEDLNVAYTQATFQGFKAFKNPRLRVLNVGGTRFGVDGLILIRNFKNLEELYMFQAGIVEQPKADVFTSLPRLRVLMLSNNQISDRGVDVMLKGHKTLERLDLGGIAAITDRGLASLIPNRSLKYLNVNGSSCTVNGAQALKAKLPDCTIVTNNGTF